MSIYYRQSFEYPPIIIFLESGSANSITNNGNVTFTLNQQIQIPNDVVGCFIIRTNNSQYLL